VNIIDRIRCIHRHAVHEHPSCFLSGNVVDKREDKSIPWYKEAGLKIGYLDIESDGLKADFATMLSWAIKEKDGKVYYDTVTKEELFNGTGDKRLVSTLLSTLSHFKIIVSYYGTGFDLKYIRSKALHYGLPFPEYGDIFHFDLYYSVKNKLCLSRSSLANATEYLGIEGKTPLKHSVWVKAKYGDPEALALVLEHNIADVKITEELHNKLEPFSKWTRKSI
jgi:uncharacterized protein YprB with RNaseH-like and TPR domain